MQVNVVVLGDVNTVRIVTAGSFGALMVSINTFCSDRIKEKETDKLDTNISHL